jgi:hypothetical protein
VQWLGTLARFLFPFLLLSFACSSQVTAPAAPAASPVPAAPQKPANNTPEALLQADEPKPESNEPKVETNSAPSATPEALPPVEPAKPRGNRATRCLSDADCRIVFVPSCAEMRNCTSSCPGVGTPRSFPAWQEEPPEPYCGAQYRQPPCTPSCAIWPTWRDEVPRAVCRNRGCVVVMDPPRIPIQSR